MRRTSAGRNAVVADRASFFLDSYNTIFQDINIPTGRDGRDGSEQRLQCEGILWEAALKTWVNDEKIRLKRLKEQTEQRKKSEVTTKDASNAKKRKKQSDTPDPALDDDLELKLWMGLHILKALARKIHNGVLNTCFLATETGCEHYAEELNMKNTSLLVSVPRKLEPYPSRTGCNSWMGTNAMRFYELQRGAVPAEGAAPPAVKGGAVAAPATSDGQDGDASMPYSPGSPDGAGGPATRSRVPEDEGKVR